MLVSFTSQYSSYVHLVTIATAVVHLRQITISLTFSYLPDQCKFPDFSRFSMWTPCNYYKCLQMNKSLQFSLLS